MKISDNFARGLWFTYDGTNPTNGFHPLWAALVAVVLKLFGSGAGAELYFPIQFLFFLLAIVGLFFILVRQSASLPLALMLALIVGLSAYYHKISITGLETPLFLAVAMLTVLLFDDLTLPNRGGAAVLAGVLLALCFLSRLEAGFMLCAVFGVGYMLRQWRQPGGYLRIVLFGTGMAVPALGYVLLSKVMTGLIMPVSALFKAQTITGSGTAMEKLASTIYDLGLPFSALARTFDELPPSRDSLLGGWIGLVLIVVYLAVQAKTRRLLSATSLYCLAAVLNFLLNKVAYSFAPIGYYYIAPLAFAYVMMLGTLVGMMTNASVHSTMGRYDVTFLVVLIAAPFIVYSADAQTRRGVVMTQPGGDFDRVQAGEWMKVNLRPEDGVASFNSGMYGWFADKNIINLDGKVNSRAYFNLIHQDSATLTAEERARRVQIYLKNSKVTVLAEKMPCNSTKTFLLAPYVTEITKFPDIGKIECSYIFRLN